MIMSYAVNMIQFELIGILSHSVILHLEHLFSINPSLRSLFLSLMFDNEDVYHPIFRLNSLRLFPILDLPYTLDLVNTDQIVQPFV